MKSIEKDENVAVGVIVIVATVLAMSFADAIVKLASSNLPLWQIYVTRSLIAIPVICSLYFFGTRTTIRPKSMVWTLLRSMLLALMYVAIYAAAPVLSLSVIGASLYTAPLFIILFSALLIGDKISWERWVAIVLGFVGVLMIIRPDTDDFSLAMLIPIIAAILYALVAIITRTKCVNEKPLVLALALNYSLLFVGLAMTGLIAIVSVPKTLEDNYSFLLGGWVPMNVQEWSTISLLAILIVGIGIGLAKAYQSGAPAVIATFDYAYLIFAVMWSYIFFSETPNTNTIVGMSLIIISGVVVINPRALIKYSRTKDA